MGKGLQPIAIAVSAAACVLACNAVLGITAVPFPDDGGGGEPSDGAVPSVDAADASTTPSGDAAPDAGRSSTDGAASCTDTTSDTHNCGACGHDCLGGPCSMKVCQPVALVSDDAGVAPWGLAQDGTYLYWTDMQNGAISRTSKDGGGTTPLTSATTHPESIAVDDAGMYWGDSDGVWRCSKTACSQSVMPSRVANANGPVFSVAIDSEGIYWSENSTQVLSANKFGNAENGVAIWQGDASVNSVATDGQRVYFTAEDGVLRGVGVDGGGGFGIGTPGATPSAGVALSAGYVYWTLDDPSQGAVATASTTLLTQKTLATTQLAPFAVASDGVNAYWTNVPSVSSDTSQIVECAVDNCTPTEVVVAHGFHPNAIVVDDTAVYWTDSQSATGTNGSLWKLAK